MKKTVFTLGAVLLFTAACAVENTDEIVEKAVAAQENLDSYYAEVESRFTYDGEEETSFYKEWVKGDQYRYEYDDYVSVSDGETTWFYDSQENSVFIMDEMMLEDEDMPDQSEMMREMLTDMMESNDVTAHGKETIAGRDTIHLSLTPVDEEEIAMFGEVSYEIWIDEETYMPLKMEWESDDFTSSMVYTEIEYNLDLSDDFFAYEIPEGAEVQTWEDELDSMMLSLDELRETTDMPVPEFTYLPEGFEFESAFHYEESGGEAAMLDFTDGGLGYFTLSISTTEDPYGLGEEADKEVIQIGDLEGERITVYDMTILSWTAEEVQYELLSFGEDLSDEELLKVAEGLE
ncbi:hypothetical protein CR205_18600 [Alteribacter lacisalsi]|uniref:DUF4367 domain-containing protein n=1 Tax=Alteribacter lacisalsi TaxID=2045244 RepID=A0A2W0H3G2_9BACI|nr:DUF4367 domain-containing protein [Alteribacter lacisalsi]PYZ95541.1 hypothetical protein CR205_18600 [Alteribacter lacisalsi]